MAPSNLLLTGGYFHAFEVTAPMLAGVLQRAGFESEIVDDLESGWAGALERSAYDLVTVYALRWRMLHPRFDDDREAWSFSLPEAGRAALRTHLRRGGGVLALHTAAICFDDWPEWAEIVGATWNWERSTHPPPRPLRVEVRTDAHPIVAGISDFDVEDEVYSFLDWQPDAEPLMSSAYRDVAQPLLVARHVHGGRVVYDALGHDQESICEPTHSTILRRGALWAAGRSDADVGSTW